MPVHATLKRSYSIKMLIIAVVFLVLGLWGIYDYAYAIPRKQEAAERLAIARDVRAVLAAQRNEPGYQDMLSEAREAVAQEMQQVAARLDEQVDAELGDTSRPDTDQEKIQAIQEAIKDIGAESDVQWLQALMLFEAALQNPPYSTRLTGVHEAADNIAEHAINSYGDVTPPAEFDRLMQWLFILCLPSLPFIGWSWLKRKRQFYRLDEEGNLHMQQSTWARDDIKDIDMSRWMDKSVAWVEHADGTRVKLDDVYYKDLHLIVGAIAHRLYPDTWTTDARPQDVVEPGEDAEQAAAASEPEAADTESAESEQPGTEAEQRQ